MSTVKIKTEPATEPTTAAATTAIDVKVKLEPSLSSSDIKLEQYTSDIDTKVESESDSEEDIKSEHSDDEDTDQNQDTAASKKRQYICDHPGCSRRFNFGNNLGVHRHEHRLQTHLNLLGETYTLTRQSLKDRWPCPTPDCTSTLKTVHSLYNHIRRSHGNNLKQQHQLPPTMKTRHNLYFLGVDSFYVNGVRCGYHNPTGVFLCHECRLVPECLLTHLQQKHGYDEKSIDNSALPDSAVNASADPNINQHSSNPHLAPAISKPYQQHHPDIVHGWLCVTSNCGCCSYSIKNKSKHKGTIHQSEQISTVPALVLRLVYNKSNSCCFLITRTDQASGAVVTKSNRVNQNKLDYSHNGSNAHDENGDDVDQNETTEVSNRKQQWKCDYNNCKRSFNSASHLSMHRREHKLEVVINVYGETFTLSRQSLDDQWACPIPDCETKCKTIHYTCTHIRSVHSTSVKHKRVNSDDDANQQQQYQPPSKKARHKYYFVDVDDFYVNGIRCGYHNPTRVFICHECRLVPECLLIHLQQLHEYVEKSIDNSVLPESAVAENADPNGNQHTSNSHLAAAIREPSQPQHHQDILQGWLCVTSDCGYCYSSKRSSNDHRFREHKGKRPPTVPALVLRLLYAKTHTSCFLITRLYTATTNNINSNDSTSQCNSEHTDDDGDELVLSDYSDEDDIN